MLKLSAGQPKIYKQRFFLNHVHSINQTKFFHCSLMLLVMKCCFILWTTTFNVVDHEMFHIVDNHLVMKCCFILWSTTSFCGQPENVTLLSVGQPQISLNPHFTKGFMPENTKIMCFQDHTKKNLFNILILNFALLHHPLPMLTCCYP